MTPLFALFALIAFASNSLLLLSERVTPRLLLSSALILGGVGFALATRRVDKR